MSRFGFVPRCSRIAVVALAGLAFLLTLVVLPQRESRAAFPGTNGKIVFVGVPYFEGLYVMDPDGSDVQLLAQSAPVSSYRRPAWSPSGTKIALEDYGVLSIIRGTRRVAIMDADGSDFVALTELFFGRSGAPSWSPGGTQIVFDSGRDGGNSEIYVMDADGTDQTRITNNSASDTAPAWSPDGTKIAFISDRDGNAEVYLMDPNGSNQARLTNDASTDLDPNWSPDGTKIAFSSDRDGNHEIYVMDADGTDQTRLTNNAASEFTPAWSPDGTKIAFASDRDGNYEIYIMSTDGSAQVNLTNDPGPNYDPDWQPLQLAPTQTPHPTFTPTRTPAPSATPPPVGGLSRDSEHEEAAALTPSGSSGAATKALLAVAGLIAAASGITLVARRNDEDR